MSEQAMEALRTAVNLARNECIAHVATLRLRLLRDGYAEDDVREALLFWANREKSKRNSEER